MWPHLVRVLAERVADVCAASGREELADDLRGAASGLDQVALPVALLGPSDSGKSTLLNALLNEALSPTDPLEATAVPLVVRAGRGPMRAEIYLDGNESIDVEPLDMVDVPAVLSRKLEDPETKGVLAVDTQIERRLLSRGLILVDVPSLHRHGRAHRRAVFDLFGESAVLVVLDASQEVDRTWVDVLAECQQQGQWCALVLSKADLAPAWRTVAQKASLTLRAEGIAAPVVPTSAWLRRRGLTGGDAAVNVGSGVPTLVHTILHEAVEPFRRRVFGGTIDMAERAIAEVRGGAALLKEAQLADTRTLADRLQDVSIRYQRLQSAKSEFPRRLNERLEQLQIDFDAFVTRSLRDVNQAAVQFIETHDPAEEWTELTAMINEDVEEATDRLFKYLRIEIDGIAAEMTAIIGNELEQLVGDLGAGSVRASLEKVKLERFRSRAGGRVEIGLDTLRGSAGGTAVANLVVGVLGHLSNPVGWAVAPFSLAFTLLLGRKSLRVAKENRITFVRRAANQQFATYFTELQSEFSAAARRVMATDRHRIRESIERQFTTLARALDADRQALKQVKEGVDNRAGTTPEDDKASQLIDLERAAAKLRFHLDRVAS